MKKDDVAKKMKYESHVATAKERSKDSYLSADSLVWSKKKGKASLNIPKSKTGKNEGNKMYEGKNEQERM